MSRHTVASSILVLGGLLLALEPYLGNPLRPPKPVPSGERIVVTVSETAERTPDQAALLNLLASTCQSRNQKYRWLDQDQAKTLEWLKPLLSQIQEQKLALPVLAVLVRPADTAADTVVLDVSTLPGGAREAIAFIDEALGVK